jgi:hypothetical protein
MTTYYCLRFETPPNWRATFPYLYPPETGWPSYTPRHWVPFSSPPTTRRATVEVFDPVSTRLNNYAGEHQQQIFCHDMLCKLVVSQLLVSKEASTELEECPLTEAVTQQRPAKTYYKRATRGSSEGSHTSQRVEYGHESRATRNQEIIVLARTSCSDLHSVYISDSVTVTSPKCSVNLIINPNPMSNHE